MTNELKDRVDKFFLRVRNIDKSEPCSYLEAETQLLIKDQQARIEELGNEMFKQMQIYGNQDFAIEALRLDVKRLESREKVLVEALEKIANYTTETPIGMQVKGNWMQSVAKKALQSTKDLDAITNPPKEAPLTREELLQKYTEQELHDNFRHPDYEYRTVETGRKDGQDGCPGEGWEPNNCVVWGPNDRKNWERYEYTEDNYWMRKK